MPTDIAASWSHIEAFFEKHVPGAFRPRPPATIEQIEAAEKATGLILPASYRESLRIHDGIEPNEELDWFYAWWLAPIDDCVATWRDQRDYDDEDPDTSSEESDAILLGVLNHPKRLPVMGTTYWDYNVAYLDFLPGPAGKEGQLIALVSECDFELVAGSFGDFLGRVAELMATGELEIHQDDMPRVVAKADGRALGDLLVEAPPGV